MVFKPRCHQDNLLPLSSMYILRIQPSECIKHNQSLTFSHTYQSLEVPGAPIQHWLSPTRSSFFRFRGKRWRICSSQIPTLGWVGRRYICAGVPHGHQSRCGALNWLQLSWLAWYLEGHWFILPPSPHPMAIQNDWLALFCLLLFCKVSSWNSWEDSIAAIEDEDIYFQTFIYLQPKLIF